MYLKFPPQKFSQGERFNRVLDKSKDQEEGSHLLRQAHPMVCQNQDQAHQSSHHQNFPWTVTDRLACFFCY